MKKAVIVGAGPAGLTAAFELLTRTDIIPVIIESDKQVGGISKTIDHNGNKIDIGGHRFFSKSSRVIQWWLNFLPLEATGSDLLKIQYHNQQSTIHPNDHVTSDPDKVMLIRKRKSRIFYQGKLYDYPVQLSLQTLRNLGIGKTIRIIFSYIHAKLFPKKPEDNLESFFINRFGKELYETFFKDYTQKVWGKSCDQIAASWGRQRIKNLNVTKLVANAFRSLVKRNNRLDQRGTSTSLIEQFMYPKYGPGQMWEAVANEITRLGGQILLNHRVKSITGDGTNRIVSMNVENLSTHDVTDINGDYFFSTMPLKDLLSSATHLSIPSDVKAIASALEYRDFLIVGLLGKSLLLKDKHGEEITDNWIYVQDKNVKAGRLQFFHNWSPGMVADPLDKWLGVEYFSNESESFWQLSDAEIISIACKEMQAIGVLDAANVTDSVVIRVKKAYPSYYGSYDQFIKVKEYLKTIENLFPIGRNGMHRYNNSDHSMLTAMIAVDNIIEDKKDTSNIWEVNTEEEYHEE